MKKEELSTKYAEKAVRENPNNLYKGYHFHRQMELTRFDGYDIQQAWEDGYDAGLVEWKKAQGEDLPEYGREVIVLVKYNTRNNIHNAEYPTYRVHFGHRPDPKGWDGKSITSGEVVHHDVKTYDEGGWNQPNVIYWLDMKLPKI